MPISPTWGVIVVGMWSAVLTFDGLALAQNCSAVDLQTQTGMNECAARSAHSADTELNSVYQDVLRRYSDDKLFIDKIREAQRAGSCFATPSLRPSILIRINAHMDQYSVSALRF